MSDVRPTVTLTDIQGVASQIAERFQPQRIILVGSYAEGRPTRDSDVDLLVVMDAEENPMHVAGLISAAVDHPFPMDILVMTPARLQEYLNERAVFATQIMTNGKVLYEEGHD